MFNKCSLNKWLSTCVNGWMDESCKDTNTLKHSGLWYFCCAPKPPPGAGSYSLWASKVIEIPYGMWCSLWKRYTGLAGCEARFWIPSRESYFGEMDSGEGRVKGGCVRAQSPQRGCGQNSGPWTQWGWESGAEASGSSLGVNGEGRASGSWGAFWSRDSWFPGVCWVIGKEVRDEGSGPLELVQTHSRWCAWGLSQLHPGHAEALPPCCASGQEEDRCLPSPPPWAQQLQPTGLNEKGISQPEIGSPQAIIRDLIPCSIYFLMLKFGRHSSCRRMRSTCVKRRTYTLTQRLCHLV